MATVSMEHGIQKLEQSRLLESIRNLGDRCMLLFTIPDPDACGEVRLNLHVAQLMRDHRVAAHYDPNSLELGVLTGSSAGEIDGLLEEDGE